MMLRARLQEKNLGKSKIEPEILLNRHDLAREGDDSLDFLNTVGSQCRHRGPLVGVEVVRIFSKVKTDFGERNRRIFL